MTWNSNLRPNCANLPIGTPICVSIYKGKSTKALARLLAAQRGEVDAWIFVEICVDQVTVTVRELKLAAIWAATSAATSSPRSTVQTDGSFTNKSTNHYLKVILERRIKIPLVSPSATDYKTAASNSLCDPILQWIERGANSLLAFEHIVYSPIGVRESLDWNHSGGRVSKGERWLGFGSWVPFFYRKAKAITMWLLVPSVCRVCVGMTKTT